MALMPAMEASHMTQIGLADCGSIGFKISDLQAIVLMLLKQASWSGFQ
jgi:hypothetical protein